MFIVFEGHDGVGKTTQVNKLKEHFESLGKEVVLVRSPGGTPKSEAIRDIALIDQPGDVVSREVRHLLMVAARTHTFINVIQPALLEGKVVIADRWLWSGYLYQVIGEGLDREFFVSTNIEFMKLNPRPDLTIVLTLEEKERIYRKQAILAKTNPDKIHSMELMGNEFEQRVSAACAELDGLLWTTQRVVHVPQKADTSIDSVHSTIMSMMEGLWDEKL